MTEPPYRGYHDIGGLPGGPVIQDEHLFEGWQALSESIRGALTARGHNVTLDELRRSFESFGVDLYKKLGFYERRTEALCRLLAEKGFFSVEEVHARMEQLAAARGQAVDHAAKTVTGG
jgi:hypothetical protein